MFKKNRAFFCIGSLLFTMLLGCVHSYGTEESVSKVDILEKAKIGALEGISIEIGASKKEVVHNFGKPIRTGNSEYGFSMYYDGFSLEFEDYATSIDEIKEESKVVLINAEPKIVGITGKPNEISKSLGKPSRTILDDTGDNTYILEYEVINYLLIFTFDTDQSPVKYITLRIK
ncbi:DUF4309 domain-containing protein [Brevibacillus composti]|nr:DUF4309 domain-containing protein [Brevibacillus composti]